MNISTMITIYLLIGFVLLFRAQSINDYIIFFRTTTHMFGYSKLLAVLCGIAAAAVSIVLWPIDLYAVIRRDKK